ncbi:RICIN domain-containing protein [Streptomyces sp. R44]|uniref:RICIN domain-containing protein n=1 Tax=Streptomyces sp. R44 TaxID=3238633 RepID=A0AB39TD58_9ACTN
MKLTAFARARHGLLVLTASLGLILGLSATPAQAASPSWYYLATVTIRPDHNPDHDKCLEVADWSTANGAAVRQWTCTGGANQQWQRWWWSGNPEGSYYYVNVHSGKCLEIGGWATNDGATANQWDCHYGLNQLFYSGLYGNRLATEAAYVPNKCLEIADWSRENGAPARLWTCHYGDNQGYSITAV